MPLDILSDAAVLRALILLLPVFGLALVCLLRPPSYFQAVGLLLAVLLNIPYLFLLNSAAQYLAWWHFQPAAPSFFNLPIELMLGWAIFWGGLVPYVFRGVNILLTVGAVVLLDLWLMPQLTGVFQLGDCWWLGEVLLLVTCLVPGICIFQFTQQRRCVALRCLLQSYIWGGWLVFFIPSILLHIEGKQIFSLPRLAPLSLLLFALGMALSLALGYWALLEFARRGGGTPIPFDPPVKLVSTGIYAHVANPMQISSVLIFISFALAYESGLMLAAIVSLLIYCEAFVRWHHRVDIEQRFADDWRHYRRQVNNWWPRFKPYQPCKNKN